MLMIQSKIAAFNFVELITELMLLLILLLVLLALLVSFITLLVVNANAKLDIIKSFKLLPTQLNAILALLLFVLPVMLQPPPFATAVYQVLL